MNHIRTPECNIHNLTALQRSPYDAVSCCPASCYDLSLVGRHVRMTFDLAFSHNGHLQIVIIFQRKVMNHPRTKRQQESKDKYNPISPVDVQRFQNLMKQILHLRISCRKLLLVRICKVLYKSLLAYADLNIVIHLDKH